MITVETGQIQKKQQSCLPPYSHLSDPSFSVSGLGPEIPNTVRAYLLTAPGSSSPMAILRENSSLFLSRGVVLSLSGNLPVVILSIICNTY